MERYINDLKMKWRTSLDLLAEEVDTPYGVFIRFLDGSWEIFATNTGGEEALPAGMRCTGRPFSRDLFALFGADPFYRSVDLSSVEGEIGSLARSAGITHCCGFSVAHGRDPFGMLLLAGMGPIAWDKKRETFLLRFKTLLEDDLTVIADKARFCDELTRTRLNGGKGTAPAVPSPEDGSLLAPDGDAHPAATPILPLMDDVHRSHESYMPRDVKLITRIRCPSDYSLYTDGNLVKQILSRLLMDAVSRTRTGEIKIECRLDDRHGRFLFSVSHPGEGELRDGGGEAMAVSRNLSERLGGRLTSDTRRGKGTAVILSLPLENPAEATA